MGFKQISRRNLTIIRPRKVLRAAVDKNLHFRHIELILPKRRTESLIPLLSTKILELRAESPLDILCNKVLI